MWVIKILTGKHFNKEDNLKKHIARLLKNSDAKPFYVPKFLVQWNDLDVTDANQKYLYK